MKFNIIAAYCKNNGIGINNNLPWKIASDMKKFKDLTIGNGNNCIIMGSKTWLSLKSKGLKSRDNLILSNTLEFDYINDNNIIKTFNNIDNLKNFINLKEYSEVWIIGGSSIYELFLNNTNFKLNEIYITYLNHDYECDTFFPKIDTNKFYFVSKKIHSKLIINDDSNVSDDSNVVVNDYIYDIIYKSY